MIENGEPLDRLAMSGRYAEATNEGFAKELRRLRGMAEDWLKFVRFGRVSNRGD